MTQTSQAQSDPDGNPPSVADYKRARAMFRRVITVADLLAKAAADKDRRGLRKTQDDQPVVS